MTRVIWVLATSIAIAFSMACSGPQDTELTSPEPTEELACGEQSCNVGEYCTLTYPSSVPGDVSATCSVLPATCEGVGDCACLGADTEFADMLHDVPLAHAMCVEDVSGPTLQIFMPCPH